MISLSEYTCLKQQNMSIPYHKANGDCYTMSDIVYLECLTRCSRSVIIKLFRSICTTNVLLSLFMDIRKSDTFSRISVAP